MPSPTRLLIAPRTYLAGLHGLLGALLSLPAAGTATLVLLVDWPRSLRGAAFTAALLLLIGAAGAVGSVRRLAVELARRMLGVDLPTPARPGWSNRWRTVLWLLLHTAAGWLLAGMLPLLVVLAGMMPGMWLSGGGRLDYLWWSIPVTSGPAGAWTLAASAAHLVVAGGLVTAVALGLRAGAGALLGHSAAERLAALASRADALAHRNRLARELHDTIGHTLTASTIQAAVAGQLMEADPAAARRALAGIEESSRAALDDLDHVLAVLREDRPGTAPSRGLADLPQLVDRIRGTGAVIHSEITGEIERVPATTSREAYRIVQEGLTNAIRHSRSAPVWLRVARNGDELRIDITNPLAGDSPAAGRATAGRGLTGITERVRLLGGEAWAGVDSNGCWVLSAWLPIPSAS